MSAEPVAVPHQPLETAMRQIEEMNRNLAGLRAVLSAIAEVCAGALKRGGTIYFCGNGGSAAESQHLATEFVVRLSSSRNRPALSAIALTTDTSLITACSNDLGFEKVFARQVEAHVREGDVLILLSTSGESPNLLEAARAARAKRAFVIGFLGNQPAALDPLCDHALHIPSPASQRVQEGHLICGHVLVEMVEDMLAAVPHKSGISV